MSRFGQHTDYQINAQFFNCGITDGDHLLAGCILLYGPVHNVQLNATVNADAGTMTVMRGPASHSQINLVVGVPTLYDFWNLDISSPTIGVNQPSIGVMLDATVHARSAYSGKLFRWSAGYDPVINARLVVDLPSALSATAASRATNGMHFDITERLSFKRRLGAGTIDFSASDLFKIVGAT